MLPLQQINAGQKLLFGHDSQSQLRKRWQTILSDCLFWGHFYILNEDILSFKVNTDPLETKLLLLEGVDFQLSHNGKLVVKVKQHQSGSDENVIGVYLF